MQRGLTRIRSKYFLSHCVWQNLSRIEHFERIRPQKKILRKKVLLLHLWTKLWQNKPPLSIKAPVSTWSRSPELKVQLWKTAVNRDSFESSASIPSQVYREKRNGNVVIFIRRLVFKVRRREQCLLSPDYLDTSFVRFLFATTRLENSKRREENFLSLIFEYIEKRRCLNFV